MTAEPAIDLGFLDQSMASRARQKRQRAMASLGVPILVTVSWLAVVTVGDHWGRISDHLGAAVTMVFGSFLATLDGTSSTFVKTGKATAPPP